MAFDITNFKMGEEFGIFRNHHWYYETTDSQATMNTAGYFSAAQATYERGVQPGDEIYATIWTTAVPTGPKIAPTDVPAGRIRFLVNSVSAAGVIDVADGDAYTVTDTD